MRNTTSDFIRLGLFEHAVPQLLLFMMVLTIAFSSLVGNALMLLLIHWDPQLHTPMYFLLSQLSLMDMLLAAIIVPKMSADYLTGKKSISPVGYGLHIFVSLTMGGGKSFLLATMSYDHYVAVCHPLRYHIFMSGSLCQRMTLGSWFLAAADGLMQAAATLSFPYCSTHEMAHFFCEVPTLVRLACADMSVFKNVMYICCVLMLLVPLSLIMTSCLVLSAVLQMHSGEVLKKAFATCSSHLCVVGLFHAAAIFTYTRPTSYRVTNHDKVVSAFYTIFTPALNSLIYSLRNSEVKGALRKCLGNCAALSHD
ncbi:LOW QUALITY PROTEIN: olfactory receptor 2T33-like [Hipposideros larvatus]